MLKYVQYVKSFKKKVTPKNLAKTACFACKGFGHEARNCTAPTSKKCKTCGKVHHVKDYEGEKCFLSCLRKLKKYS